MNNSEQANTENVLDCYTDTTQAIINRDERHPLMDSQSNAATITSQDLHNILNSIIASTQPRTDIVYNGQSERVQYLLPVDLLVSVDEQNQPQIQAALPSSFAFVPPSIHCISSLPPLPANNAKNIDININKSTLNPSAASFTPFTPYTVIPPILEQNEQKENEQNELSPDDEWCLFDDDDIKSIPDKTEKNIPSNPQTPKKQITQKQNAPTFKARKYRFKYNEDDKYNTNWRNHDNRSMLNNVRWRNDKITNKYRPSSNNKMDATKAKSPRIKPPRILAEFVKHVTLKNREECPPNTVLTKTWAMKNCGECAWGFNVELVYCKGDESLSLNHRYPVINAQPGQEIEISATIKTSKKPGRYCTYFRLQKNGRFFGPRVWADIIVSDFGQKATAKCREEDHHKSNKTNKWKKKYGTVVSCK